MGDVADDMYSMALTQEMNEILENKNMASKQGVIERYSERKTQRGSTLYSIQLDDGEWYGFGFTAPIKEIEQGDTVKFELVKNSKGYDEIVSDSLQVKKNTSTKPATPAKKAAGGKENWDARAKYWEDKEQRDIVTQHKIQYAGALNTAVAVAEHLIALNGFPVTAATMKKKEGVDAALEVIYKMADELYLRIGSRPFELEALDSTLTEAEVAGKSDLEATEKEEDKSNDPWGDD